MKQNLIVILFAAFLFSPFVSRAQNMVADTIRVHILSTDSVKHPVPISGFLDLRNEKSDFLSVYEQNKFLFFPVDQMVLSTQPLNKALKEYFAGNSHEQFTYHANIRSFTITQAKSFTKRDYILFSTLELLKVSNSDTSLVGTLYYEYPFQQHKNDSVTVGYQKVIGNWANQLSTDVSIIDKDIDELLGGNLYHFRRGERAVKKNLYTAVEVFGGFNFWGIDGEIWFSEPEGNQIFNRHIGLMRYTNQADRHTIALGRNMGQWNYRVNEQFLFSNKIAFLIGFNNWKDMATVNHKMEEIPAFSLSFSQRINYNSLDKSGLVFGLGIMEDLSYVIYHKPQLKIGLTLNCAYKF